MGNPNPKSNLTVDGVKTTKQERIETFANHYVIYGNATKAYSAAYPETKYKHCGSKSCNFMKDEKVKLAIEKARDELKQQVILTREAFIKDMVDTAQLAKNNRQYNAYCAIMNTIGKTLGHINNNVDVTSGGEKINIVLNLGEYDK